MAKGNNSPQRRTPHPLSPSNRPGPPQPQKPTPVFSEVYTGPVPPPEILEKMDQAFPGAAERIFAMAEKEQDASIEDRRCQQHRADQIEKDRHREQMTALWMAFGVCIVFVTAGCLMVFWGHEKIGATLVGTTLAGVIYSFLVAKRKK